MSSEELRQMLIEKYTRNVGHPPITRFPDDPDWNYRGGKVEREKLEEPVVIEGQERLFDA
jgi:hypothetical protein